MAYRHTELVQCDFAVDRRTIAASKTAGGAGLAGIMFGLLRSNRPGS
jgi:hypothetical protein